MAQDDPVKKALEGAKNTLANANKFTKSVVGNATDAFAGPAPKKLNVPQAKKPEVHEAPYSLANEASDAASGIKARRENVEQYLKASKPE